MKKFVFICLLTAYFMAPFIHSAYMSCGEDEQSHFCQMQGDHEEAQNFEHHCGCAGFALFQEQIKISLNDLTVKNFGLSLSESIVNSENLIGLYRPPIA